LLARLGDSEVGVRMMAAQAIGRLRDSSTIDALGAMGPAASAAVPTLRDLTKIPRVEWAAKAAIRRINGQL